MKLRRSLPLLMLAGVVSLIAGIVVARMLAQKTVTLHSGTWLPQPRPLASFQLNDFSGHRFGNPALLGHPSLVFFGFTNCPDICPATLATLRAVRPQRFLPGVQILFVTVDPERDTPEALKAYLHAFGDEFLGLYAERAALEPLARSLGAVSKREDLPGDTYMIDHSATLYLLDTRGRMAAVFTPPLTTAGLSADLLAVAQGARL